MTPHEMVNGLLEDRRRRFQDQPAMMTIQAIWWIAKIVLALTITWGAVRMGGILVEFKPMKEIQAKQTAALDIIVGRQAIQTTDIQVLKEKTDNIKDRLLWLENRRARDNN